MSASDPGGNSGSDRSPSLESQRGRVIALLPQAKFRVELLDHRQVLAHFAAGSDRNFVRLREGDEVDLILSPLDGTRGRIVKVIRTV